MAQLLHFLPVKWQVPTPCRRQVGGGVNAWGNVTQFRPRPAPGVLVLLRVYGRIRYMYTQYMWLDTYTLGSCLDSVCTCRLEDVGWCVWSLLNVPLILVDCWCLLASFICKVNSYSISRQKLQSFCVVVDSNVSFGLLHAHTGEVIQILCCTIGLYTCVVHDLWFQFCKTVL